MPVDNERTTGPKLRSRPVSYSSRGTQPVFLLLHQPRTLPVCLLRTWVVARLIRSNPQRKPSCLDVWTISGILAPFSRHLPHSGVATPAYPRHLTHVMATDFIMPRMADHQQTLPQHQRFPHPYYSNQPLQYTTTPTGAYTPQISPLTTGPFNPSGHQSPTSPNTNVARQNRPLFMPAVLRPTRYPSKAPPPRPKSADDEDTSEEGSLRSNNNSFMNLGGLGGPILGRLSRRSTGESTKCDDAEWDFHLYPEPSGPPTKDHWKVCSERIRRAGQTCLECSMC